MTVAEIQDRLTEVNAESQSILAAADADKRDLSGEEQEKLDLLIDEFEVKKADLARMQAIGEQAAMLAGSGGRRTQAEEPRTASDDAEELDDTAATPTRPAMATRARREPNINVKTDRSRWGWPTFGEFAAKVRHACINGGHIDQRLQAQMAPTSYGNEGAGAEGGFAVPPDFRAEIFQKISGEESLLSRTDQLTSSSNSITVPKDETTPWQTTGGIQAYWDGEAAQASQSKPTLEAETIKLNKLISLVPVTEELLEDAPALDTYLRRKAPQKMDSRIAHAIVQGDGVGKPLGILNSPSLVTVADENGAYITPLDIYNMWSRMYAPLTSGAVWLINQDVYPELLNLNSVIKNVAGTENVGGGPVFVPPGGLSSSPFATLMGRPIIPTQACKSLNTPGDILFVNLMQYMTVVKSGGMRTDTSVHLYFDYAMTAYRFIFRLAGQPWWKSAATPQSGSGNTLSWAVALDTRT